MNFHRINMLSGTGASSLITMALLTLTYSKLPPCIYRCPTSFNESFYPKASFDLVSHSHCIVSNNESCCSNNISSPRPFVYTVLALAMRLNRCPLNIFKGKQLVVPITGTVAINSQYKQHCSPDISRYTVWLSAFITVEPSRWNQCLKTYVDPRLNNKDKARNTNY